MAEPAVRPIEMPPWNLATLADETAFEGLIGATAGAIADRFTLKVHQNVVSRRMAYTAWIDSLANDNMPTMDYRAFIAVCSNLIAAIARHRVVSFSAMIRDPDSRLIGTVLRYPNEVTALAAGAALYSVRVAELTGRPAGSGPLPAMLVENAAANLSRHPEAAVKFRELLQLSTPWT